MVRLLLTSAALAATLAMPLAAQEGPSTESIGVDLAGLVLLDETAPVTGQGRGEVTADGVTLVPAETLETDLAPFLGRPISQALLAEIEATIVSAFRDRGFPFVAVAIPPQEITGGVLNLRVVPFRAAQVIVTGTEDAALQGRIAAGLRQEIGAPIDARVMEQDLEWLNRSPLRRVAAEFSPGTAPSTTDITLATSGGRPWQGTAGITNTGGAATGANRLTFGVSAIDLIGPGSTLSLRVTASTEESPVEEGRPAYLGTSLNAVIPLAPRQELGFDVNLTETGEQTGFFTTETVSQEIVLSWTAALTEILPGRPGTIRAAFENRAQDRTLGFAGIDLATDSFTARNIVLSWQRDWRGAVNDPLALRHSLDAGLHLSPGNLGEGNGDAELSEITAGRATDARYAYLTAGYELTVPFASGRAADLTANLQWASGPLPDTERISVGGLEAVRGYGSDDGAFDSALILRGDLSLTAEPIAAGPVELQPYAFADMGFGRDLATDDDVALAGAGLGLRAALFGGAGSASAILGVPLRDGPESEAGDPVLQINLNVQF